MVSQSPYTYDYIAEHIYAPLFPFYARLIIDRTAVKSGRLLDVGCGGGHLGLALLDAGTFDTATFIDIDAHAIENTAKRVRERGYEPVSHFIKADVSSLPFEDECFDLVVSRGSMPFWEDQATALHEIYRVLAPDGYAYLGGGRGTREMQARFRDLARNHPEVNPPMGGGGGNTSMLPDESYIALFRELGCGYALISSADEGHWVIFSKNGLHSGPFQGTR